MEKKNTLNKKISLEGSLGGFLSIDRKVALQYNWDEILSMARPSTVSINPSKKTKSIDSKKTLKSK